MIYATAPAQTQSWLPGRGNGTRNRDRCPPKRPVTFADFPFFPYTSISSSSHLLFRRIDWPQDGWVHSVHLFMPHIYGVYII